MSRPEAPRVTRLDDGADGARPAGHAEDSPSGTARSTSIGRVLTSLVRVMQSKVIRIGFLVAVLALLTVALVAQGETLWHEVQRLSLPIVLAALALNLCGLLCSLMVWREMLADLGSRLSIAEAWRIMFIGQLAKYMPGSIWPVLAQSELGADRGIPRRSSALSVLLSYAVMIGSGAAVAAITLPFAKARTTDQYFWVLILVPLSIVFLSPPVLNRLLALVLRLAGQPALEKGVSFAGLGRTVAWAIASWAFNGLTIYVLMRQLAGHPQGTLLVSVGAYALSWTAGFLAVFAPAGAGVREAVMVAVLSTRTTTAIALTIALVTRATAVLCDAITGAVAAALVGRRRLRQLRSARQDARLS